MVALTLWGCFLFFEEDSCCSGPSSCCGISAAPSFGYLSISCLLESGIIPKGPSTSSVANYIPISLATILSNVFERLVSVRLESFMACRGVLPTTHIAYMKGLDTVMPFCVWHPLECFGDRAGG